MTTARPLPESIRAMLSEEVLARFLRYVTITTTSDETSSSVPSTPGQLDLLHLLAKETAALGLETDLREDRGFLIARLPASPGCEGAEPLAFYAHVDTSPEQPGADVRPVVHRAWDGTAIRFADDPALALTADDSPELLGLLGETIVTASGGTLLGADDKAGVAEIVAALAAFRRYEELSHGPIVACFTTDEEVGRGTEGLDLDCLPRYGFTIDGGHPGELEDECFDAWQVGIEVHGVGVHPGSAKGRMVHAGMILARLLARFPEDESPERTEGREGFFYLVESRATVDRAHASVIVRDFEAERNQDRIERIGGFAEELEARFPGSRIEVTAREQYRNMRTILADHPDLVAHADAAIRDTGLTPLRHPIRGGTDGSLLTQLGHPTPNLFAGGMLAHSRKEWIAHRSLVQASETIIHLARRWGEAGRASDAGP